MTVDAFLCFCAGSVVSFHVEHTPVISSVLIVSLVTSLSLLICLNLKVVRFYDIKIKTSGLAFSLHQRSLLGRVFVGNCSEILSLVMLSNQVEINYLG